MKKSIYEALIVLCFSIVLGAGSGMALESQGDESKSTDENIVAEIISTEETKQQESTEEVSATEAVEIETENTETTSEHVINYDMMRTYAQTYTNQFKVSEINIDGKPYYECVRDTENGPLTLLVDAKETHATLSYQGKETEFDIPFLISPTSAYTLLEYVDMTGDGKEEFLFEYGYGTGSWENRCYIYDLETMEPYEVQVDLNDLIDQIQVEPISIFGEIAVARLIDNRGNAYFASVPLSTGWTDSAADLSFLKEGLEYRTSIGKKMDGALEASVGVTLDGAAPMNYLGELVCSYVYNEAEKIFEPDGTMIFEPYMMPIQLSPVGISWTAKDETWGLNVESQMEEAVTMATKPMAIQKETESGDWETIYDDSEATDEKITLEAFGKSELELTPGDYELKSGSAYRFAFMAESKGIYGDYDFPIYYTAYINP